MLKYYYKTIKLNFKNFLVIYQKFNPEMKQKISKFQNFYININLSRYIYDYNCYKNQIY